MTLVVPFRLRKRAASAPVAAIWLACSDMRHLAAMCLNSRDAEWPEIYATANGFIVIADRAATQIVPRSIRLRRLAGQLYLPADAELIPSLHGQEAADFTRLHGLVFLPDGSALAFDRNRPLTIRDVLAPIKVCRDEWTPLPPRPIRAEQLHSIRYDGENEPQAILESGRPGNELRPLPKRANDSAPTRQLDASPKMAVLKKTDDQDDAELSESRDASKSMLGQLASAFRSAMTGLGRLLQNRGKNRPVSDDNAKKPSGREDAGTPAGRQIAARAAIGFAKAFAGLGRMLRVPGFVKTGASLAAWAIQRVPRLSAKVFDRQEAALREILRQLREGNIERALRRAPPAVSDSGKVLPIDGGWRLGWRDPRYSLRSVINGVGNVWWLGGRDVWNSLANEYRRLAREAIARGDYRRAAYLYGVLLRDIRLAADSLAAGGLHRDAAILYRDKLNDVRSAATLHFP